LKLLAGSRRGCRANIQSCAAKPAQLLRARTEVRLSMLAFKRAQISGTAEASAFARGVRQRSASLRPLKKMPACATRRRLCRYPAISVFQPENICPYGRVRLAQSTGARNFSFLKISGSITGLHSSAPARCFPYCTIFGSHVPLRLWTASNQTPARTSPSASPANGSLGRA
jgi:hypothetical protein